MKYCARTRIIWYITCWFNHNFSTETSQTSQIWSQFVLVKNLNDVFLCGDSSDDSDGISSHKLNIQTVGFFHTRISGDKLDELCVYIFFYIRSTHGVDSYLENEYQHSTNHKMGLCFFNNNSLKSEVHLLIFPIKRTARKQTIEDRKQKTTINIKYCFQDSIISSRVSLANLNRCCTKHELIDNFNI